MEKLPTTFASTGFRNIKKRCVGVISSEIDFEKMKFSGNARNAGIMVLLQANCK